MRRSETLTLKWKDIDWSNGFIHIRKSKNKKARIVPIEDEVRSLLKQLLRNGEFVFA